MNETEIKALIQAQLPQLIAQDPLIRDFIVRTVSNYYAGKQETESKFDQMLREIRELARENNLKWEQDRAEDRRRWEEHQAKHDRELEEANLRYEQDRAEDRRRWEEHMAKYELDRQENKAQFGMLNQKIDEQVSRLEHKIDEQVNRLEQKIDEQVSRLEHKIDEQVNRLEQKIDEQVSRLEHKIDEQSIKLEGKIDELEQKMDVQVNRLDKRMDDQYKELMASMRNSENILKTGFGAIGARWGMQSEASFRNALKGILEDSFEIEVINFNEYDHEGIVFGRPDQVEIDVIIKNGVVIVCELKSSMSKSDMRDFDRKVTYYENHHARVNRKIVISPMVHPTALSLAQELGIEVYSFVDEVNPI